MPKKKKEVKEFKRGEQDGILHETERNALMTVGEIFIREQHGGEGMKTRKKKKSR